MNLTRWRKAAAALTVAALCEIGARVALPGMNSHALRIFLQSRAGGFLLRVYDGLVGGALSRGAVLALGIMPYVSARVMMRLAREAIPAVRAAWTADDHRRLTRWTRVLTAGLALVQSYGFARFVQGIPGVVADPGPVFIAQTVLVLTTGAVSIAWLTERFTAAEEHEDAEHEVDRRIELGAGNPSGSVTGQAAPLQLAPMLTDLSTFAPRQPEAVPLGSDSLEEQAP
jgi:preprotein translocase subunit SecY